MRKRNRFHAEITDEELFYSPYLQREYEELAQALTGRADPRITVKLLKSGRDEECFVARTNGTLIQMHPFSKDFAGLTRRERYSVLYGVITHEIAHVLYTDFRKHIFCSGGSGMFTTKRRILKDAGVDLDSLSYNAKAWIVELQNCIEDGYIENAFASDFAGVPSAYLRRARAFMARDYDPVPEMLFRLGLSAPFVSNCTLMYATTGRLDFRGEALEDELSDRIRTLMDIVDEAVVDTDQINRWVAAAKIFKLFEEIFKKAEEKGKEPSRDNRDVDENPGAKGPEKPKDISDHRSVSPDKDEDGEDGKAGEGKDGKDSKGKTEKGDEAPDSADSEAGGSDLSSAADESVDADMDASVSRVMKGIAEEKEEEETEAERTADAHGIPGESKGDFRLVPVNPMRWTYRSDGNKYAEVMKDVGPVSKRLQRSLISEMQDREYGSKRSGLLIGKRFEARNAYRMDMRTFSTNRAPTELKSLAVAVLVDLSGSMSSDGRIPAAVKTSALVQDFCSGLGYPAAVYGHDASYSGCNVYTFTEWSDKGKEMIADMHPMSDNHDGHALRYVKKRLLRRPEPNKLLIYISDGQPANGSYPGVAYYGYRAIEDLKNFMKEAKKDEINMICAGIGADKETLSGIYGDAFMDISDLSKLPFQIVRCIKRMIQRVG